MSRFISLSSTIKIFFIHVLICAMSLRSARQSELRKGLGLGRKGHHEGPRPVLILLHMHVAAEQTDEAQAERETDAGAAIFGRRRVAIVGEDVEQGLRRAAV